MIPPFQPPWYLRSGLTMTLYTTWFAPQRWQAAALPFDPPYQEHILTGAQDVPIYTLIAIPDQPKATLIATYGITGDLDNQWFLRLLAQRAYAQGYAVVLFDWRAHGKTAELSATLTSDGLYEGEDYVHLAAHAKALGCPTPIWFSGYSLGGQLALWGIYKAQSVADWGADLAISSQDIAGGAVICPSLESERSLRYLMADPLGRYLEKVIAKTLKKLAYQLHHYHPQEFDLEAIAHANSIWSFDEELVIGRLGFETVGDYYQASSALALLPRLHKPTLMLYAADDPLFDPSLVPEIQAIAAENPDLDLYLTTHGGHVGYISGKQGQQLAGDPDPWWAIHRLLHWFDQQSVASCPFPVSIGLH